MPNPGGISAVLPRSSNRYRCLFASIAFFCVWLTAALPAGCDETASSPDMDLVNTVALALEANISARISSERTRAADAVVKARRTEFLPTFSAQYEYSRYDEPRFIVDPSLGVVNV